MLDLGFSGDPTAELRKRILGGVQKGRSSGKGKK
jgi:hypothetical protein